MRPSCYACRYKEVPRISDISLGDFWGVRWQLDTNQGTSLVLLNTSKGRDLFFDKRVLIKRVACSLDEAKAGNPCLFTSAPDLGGRQEFFETLRRTNSFSETMAGYPKKQRIVSPRALLGRIKRFACQKVCQFLLSN